MRLIVALALHACITSVRGFALPATGLNIRVMQSRDIFPASQLLLRVFTEGDPFNPLNLISKPLILAEHVFGLRERREKNVMLVCQKTSSNEIIGTEIIGPEIILFKTSACVWNMLCTCSVDT